MNISSSNFLSYIIKNNLISIPHAPQQLNHQQRQQPLKFVLLDVRSIRKKTLLLRDYIVEHDIDLLAITETWLTDDSSDEFYCCGICPEGYKIEQLPRNYADGGGVALVYRRCFKVKKNVQTIHRSFELINICASCFLNFHFRSSCCDTNDVSPLLGTSSARVKEMS